MLSMFLAVIITQRSSPQKEERCLTTRNKKWLRSMLVWADRIACQRRKNIENKQMKMSRQIVEDQELLCKRNNRIVS